MRRTKIVATLGPATESPEMIRALIEGGADVVRLNQSHGTRAEHTRAFDRIRAASKSLGKPVAILVDLQGPKVRIGRVAGGCIMLGKGRTVDLASGHAIGDERTLYTPLPELVAGVRPGDRVLLDDGSIVLEVVSKRGGRARCRVVAGGPLSDHKGVNLPGVKLDLPSATKKDISDLRWATRSGADYAAISFVRSAADVAAVKRVLQRWKSPIRLIAKIEKPEAVEAIEEIAAVADGLLVARGDLGVEMALEDVPVAQRRIIEAAHRSDIPVIVATQMLQSMTENPRPTRAEVSDVAGAIFDGTDAVMLSGETAVGKYPVESVKQMAAIAEHIERYLESSGALVPTQAEGSACSIPDAVCHGASSAARDLAAKAVFVATESGKTALLFSKYRFAGVTVGASDDPGTVRRMALYWGIVPARVRRYATHHLLLEAISKEAVKRRMVADGDTVVFVSGVRLGKTGGTNVLFVHRIPPKRGSRNRIALRDVTRYGAGLAGKRRR